MSAMHSIQKKGEGHRDYLVTNEGSYCILFVFPSLHIHYIH